MTYEETLVWRTDEPPKAGAVYLAKVRGGQVEKAFFSYRGEWCLADVDTTQTIDVLAWAEMLKGPEL
jgi:hypothetical protein